MHITTPSKYLDGRGPAKVSITSPIKHDFDCISLPHSIAGEIEAKLVWLGEGAVDIYEKRKDEIKDSIVMVSSANPLGQQEACIEQRNLCEASLQELKAGSL